MLFKIANSLLLNFKFAPTTFITLIMDINPNKLISEYTTILIIIKLV